MGQPPAGGPGCAQDRRDRGRGRQARRRLPSLARPPFGGLLLRGPFRARITGLEEQHIEAKEALIEARLDLGAHHDLVGELRSLVGEYPLRERLGAHLMLALYRSGRQTEALRAYHEVREKLVTEVGVEPGPELRTIEQAIMTAAPGFHPARG